MLKPSFSIPGRWSCEISRCSVSGRCWSTSASFWWASSISGKRARWTGTGLRPGEGKSDASGTGHYRSGATADSPGDCQVTGLEPRGCGGSEIRPRRDDNLHRAVCHSRGLRSAPRRLGLPLQFPLRRDLRRLVPLGTTLRDCLSLALHPQERTGAAEGSAGEQQPGAGLGDLGLAGRQLLRTRDIRPVRRALHRSSLFAASAHAGRLGRPSAAQGLSRGGLPLAFVMAHLTPMPTLEASQDRIMILNMGPQHPSTHGVLRVILEIDGENVVRIMPDIGYLHTGIEKTCEAKFYHHAVL